MKKINEILIVLIFILTAVLAAAMGFRAYDTYKANRQFVKEQEEIELAQVFARNEEAQNRVREMEAEIEQLTENREELERFISRIQNDVLTESVDIMEQVEEAVAEEAAENATASGNNLYTQDGSVSGNVSVSGSGSLQSAGSVSGNGTVSGNLAGMSGPGASGDFAAFGSQAGNASVSGNSTVSGNNTVSGNSTVSGNRTVSGNGLSADNFFGGSVSSNASVSGNQTGTGPGGVPVMTLAERRKLRTSLQETLEVNQADRKRIAGSRTDFSEVKIACLGDSITAAANLEKEENYRQYAYPARLKALLRAKEVYNLGIGGSSIGRYWSDAYVDRYQEIPEDADIIIVMGGTNDGFCVSEKEFGSLEERAYRTFCGDLDELMRGLKKNYPDAEVFFATPLPNILQDYLMSERDYLLPQSRFVQVISTLAREYGFQVIDLYNSNILDSHDANVVADYVPDGVHGNHDGYQILAERFAAEIIRHYDGEIMSGISGNDPGVSISANDRGDSVSSNDMDQTVSANDTDEQVSGNDSSVKDEPGTAAERDSDGKTDSGKQQDVEWVTPLPKGTKEEQRKYHSGG